MTRNRIKRDSIKWNASLAYAIGLITTDGYLSTDKRHISLTSTDKQLLQTFKNCLKKKNTITKNPASKLTKKQAYRIQIGDVSLYDWLTEIGLQPRKSLTLAKLNIIDTYFFDFLRGHLDGDGSIIYYKDKYNTHVNPKYIYKRLFVYFRSSSKKHIKWLRNKIFILKGIKGSLNSYTCKTQLGTAANYVLKFSTKEAKLILNYIYYKPHLPCLKRKYIIAKPYLRFLQKN